jgi:hypothetical protein
MSLIADSSSKKFPFSFLPDNQDHQDHHRSLKSMPTSETFSHRSSLKQSNKPFKSKHASKGALKAKAKGIAFVSDLHK